MNVKVCQSWGSEDEKRRNICGEPVKTKDSHEDKEAKEHKSDDTDRQQMNEKDEQGCGPCGGDQQQSQGLEDGRDQGRDEGRGNPSQLLSRWGLLIQFLADFLARKNVAQVVCYLRAIRQAR